MTMRAAIRWSMAVLAGGWLMTAPVTAAPLDSELSRLIRDGASARASWGFYAVDVASGKVLGDVNSDNLFMPASNRKIVSTAMAMRYMGATKVLETTIGSDASPSGGRLKGDLVVKAVGDPSWTPGLRGGRSGAAVLKAAARELKTKGIEMIEGDLVIDASRYRNPQPVPEGWEWSDFQTSDGAIPSVFGMDRNVASVVVAPGTPGQPVRLSFESRAVAFELVNSSKTGGRDSAPTFELSRGLDGVRLTATGSLPANAAEGRRAMPLGRPVDFAAEEFAAILKEEGITLKGTTRISTNSVKADQTLVTIASTPLAEIVTEANEESDNYLAESLYLLAGAELYGRGSYEASAEAEKRLWKEAGVEATAWSGADGCGLSRRDLVTPQAMVKLLMLMHKDEAFVDSLPVSGRSGTMRYRLAENGMAGRVHAKTGTLTGVAALSGYVKANSGKTIAFSVLANNFTSSPSPIRADIDALVERLASQ